MPSSRFTPGAALRRNARHVPSLGTSIAGAYVVTPQWVRGMLRASVEHPWGGCLGPADDIGFAALLPLLCHGAMTNEAASALRPGFADDIRTRFLATDVRGFLRDAKALHPEDSLLLRTGPVGIRSEHPLASRFRAPAASDVRAALGVALREVDAAIAGQHSIGKRLLCIMIGTQVLLTIHPFTDGNGRTARMYFASKALRHVGPVPSALLGYLIMLHQGGGQQFHQACWAMRAGDHYPVLELFLRSERLAVELLRAVSGNAHHPSATRAYCRDALGELATVCRASRALPSAPPGQAA